MEGVYPLSSTVYLSFLECKCEAASECRDGASPCQREEALSLSGAGTLCAPWLTCSSCALKQKNCFTPLGCSYNTVNLTQICSSVTKLEQVSNSTCFPASVNSSCFPPLTYPVETR